MVQKTLANQDAGKLLFIKKEPSSFYNISIFQFRILDSPKSAQGSLLFSSGSPIMSHISWGIAF